MEMFITHLFKKTTASLMILLLALSPYNFNLLNNSEDVYTNIAHAADTCAANPTATTSNVPGSVLIGEPVTFSVDLNNSGVGAPGFSPFVDMILPAGADGDDGITFQSVEFGGNSITPIIVSAPLGGGDVEHPFAVDAMKDPLLVTLAAGESLVVFQAPLSSLVEDQSTVSFNVTVQVSPDADVATGLDIQTRAGFALGCDALDNPQTDPADTGGFTTTTVTPNVFTYSKGFDDEEAEASSGPGQVASFQLSVDVADGQSISDLEIVDFFPNNLFFVGIGTASSVDAVAYTDITNHPGGVSNAPANEIGVRFDAPIVGSSAAVDAFITVDFYVPDLDADGNDVIPRATGADNTIINTGQATGSWSPTDDDDAGGSITANDIAGPVSLGARPIVLKKGAMIETNQGGSGYSPGDIVKFDLSVIVSDFFAFNGITIDDELSDGLRFYATTSPEITVNTNGSSATATFTDFTVDPILSASGTQSVFFDVQAGLVSGYGTSTLLGGCIPDGGTGGAPIDCDTYNDGGTSLTVTYYAEIQDSFDVTGPDFSVDQGDVLTNKATTTVDLLDNDDLSDSGVVVTENSGVTLNIQGSVLSKNIAYINGCDPDDNLFGGGSCTFPSDVSPGDIVTYELLYEMPSADYEDLLLKDFMPIPVFNVSSINTTPNAGFSNPSFPLTGAIIDYGSQDTFNAVSGAPDPVVSVAAGNTVEIDYGTFDDTGNASTTIHLLISSQISSEPFADGLSLSNMAAVSQGATNGTAVSNTRIAQVVLRQPDLSMSKGVIGSDDGDAVFSPAAVAPTTFNGIGSCPALGVFGSSDLASTPIESDISEVSGSSTVAFAIVLENTGDEESDVFDVQLSDTVPTGFIDGGVGTYNLCVTRGDGTTLTSGVDYTGDLFNSDLELIDTGVDGSIPGENNTTPNDGSNIVVVSYELTVDPSSAIPNSNITNSATLSNYASVEGGTDFTAEDITDSAQVTVESFDVFKTILSTNNSETLPDSGTFVEAAIGERVQYEVFIEIPDNTIINTAVWKDDLPSGLVLFDDNGSLTDLVTVTGSSTVSSSEGLFSTLEPVVTGSGTELEIDLGTITNSDTDINTTEAISFVYEAVVVDVVANTRNTQLRNNTEIEWSDGSGGNFSQAGNRPNLRVAEPNLLISKGNPTGAASNASSTRDFTYEITLQHDGNSRQSPAYNVNLRDESFDGITIQTVNDPFTISNTQIQVNGGCSATTTPVDAGSATILDLTWSEIPLDCSGTGNDIVVTFDVTLDSGVTDDITSPDFTNTATTTYSSMETFLGPQSTFISPDSASTERLYTSADSYDVSWLFTVEADKCLWDNANNACHTAGYDVVVGDQVQYKSQIEIPEDSTFKDLVFTDTLDSGLALVQFDDIIVSSDLSSVAGASSTNFIDVSSATSLGLQSSATSATATEVTVNGSGDEFTLAFGDVTHADNDDLALATIEVVYTAVVTNIASNDSGQNLNNSVVAEWVTTTGTKQTSVAVSDNVTVREPNLAIDKSVTTPPAANTRTVSYQIEVTHTAPSVIDGQSAYDLEITDDSLSQTPNNPLSGVGGSSVNPAWTISNLVVDDSCGALSLNNNSSGDVIALQWTEVPVSCDTADPIVVTFDATLNDDVSVNHILVNDASIEWTTQSGDVGSSTSPFTNLDVEKTGDSSDLGGAANSLNDDDTTSTNFTFGLGVAKAAVNSTNPDTPITPLEVSIGEIITYRIAASIPANSFYEDFELRDTLDSGLELYLDPTVGYNTAGGYFNVTVSDPLLTLTVGETNPVVATTTTSFELDYYVPPTPSGSTIHNTSSSTQTLLVEYKALVTDVVTNSGVAFVQTTLNNNYQAEWLSPIPDDPGTLADESDPTNRALATGTAVSATVVEPILDITKSVSISPAFANDRNITYQFEVCHAAGSTGDAYDVEILDDTGGLVFDPSSITLSANVMAPTTYSVASSSASMIEIQFDNLPQSFSCASNPVIVTFEADLQDSISVDTDLANEVDLEWKSLLDSVDTTDSSRDSMLQDTAIGTFLFDINFTKTLIGDGSDDSTSNGAVRIGEVIDFRLNIPVPANTFFDNFSVRDILDGGLAFVGFTGISRSSADVTSNDGVATSTTVIDLDDLVALNARAASTTDTTVQVLNNGQEFVINFDRLQNEGASDQLLQLEYQALVLNNATSAATTTLGNSAEITWQDTNPTTGATTSESQTDAITPQSIVEPQLSIVKETVPYPSGLIVDGARDVTYRVTISHTGDNATAYNINLQDDLSAIPDSVGNASSTGFMDYYLDYNVGSLTEALPAGTAQTGITETVDLLDVTYDRLNFGDSIVLEFTMKVEPAPTTPANSMVDNIISGTWTSNASGTSEIDISPYSDQDDLQVGRSASTTLGAFNNYTASDTAAFGTFEYADLSLEKTALQSQAVLGDTVTFTIQVDNNGTATATNIVVMEQLPSSMTFSSATTTVGTYSTTTSQWTIPELQNGFSAIMSISGVVAVNDSLENIAYIESVDQPDPDSIPGNLASSEDDYSTATIDAESGGGGGGRRYCRDEDATNYSTKKGKTDNSLCKYEEDVVNENTVDLSDIINQLIALVNLQGEEPGASEVVPPITSQCTTAQLQYQFETCDYFTQWLRPGDRDGEISQYVQDTGNQERVTEVKKLQNWLNTYYDANIPVTGFYGPQTEEAVHAYQAVPDHYKFIITPWVPPLPDRTTGNWYKTSRYYGNYLMGCQEGGKTLEANNRYYDPIEQLINIERLDTTQLGNCDLPEIKICITPFTQHMTVGDRDGQPALTKQELDASNIISEVALLQRTLQSQGFYSGAISGYFGVETKKAVDAWQVEHKEEVLDPWGLRGPTGWFYQSSERWMNELVGCEDSVTLDNGTYLD